jgi:hypothetical protein
MSLAIAALRERLPVERPISIIHADLPENDFSSLFRVLENDPASCLRAQPQVFASAAGRSLPQIRHGQRRRGVGWPDLAEVWPFWCAITLSLIYFLV